jgi:hypothetical protein
MILPAPRADNPTRTLATTIVLAACLLLVAAGGSAQASEVSGGSSIVQQPLTAPGGAFAGKRTTLNGHIDDYTGRVSLTARRGRAGAFMPVGTAFADADGDFKFAWKPPQSGLYGVRIEPLGAAVAASTPVQGSLAVYRRQKATWYGPGWYGSRTACGVKLTRRTLGVAHRSLPCGTRVEFFLRGRRVTVPVIDRGPYVRGVTWDLTLTAMKRLGSSSTEVLGAVALR